ncbi:MAG TPA: hypothetical protein VIO64_17480 [Pseudobacteroides sp.]|uniref:hypothetical protein n=1 Tax=Pseudobacteroides sp. TaxID=1968840 RepID=UPI002F951E4F
MTIWMLICLYFHKHDKTEKNYGTQDSYKGFNSLKRNQYTFYIYSPFPHYSIGLNPGFSLVDASEDSFDVVCDIPFSEIHINSCSSTFTVALREGGKVLVLMILKLVVN